MTAPRKPGVAASERITVRLTKAERRELDKRARRAGMHPSEYMRALALGLGVQTTLPKVRP